ncbi:AraC family transcriptional regulator [Gottfriedia luciferensis]|uniref:AraC family transcriptional regulator n=1 Tax=Gottfriedia luciferensis TaxID=178774 RepID=UPI000B4347D2|nr:AraC family transcriptional regulator [Gottfriedia luciferensis]
MTDQIYTFQDELARLIESFTNQDGVHETEIPSLFLIRESHVTEPIYRVYKPCICIIVQGEKELMLANERFKYGPSNYLVASVDLPVSGQIITASPNAPYLSLKLEFTPKQIVEILSEVQIDIPKDEPKRGIFVGQLEESIVDAIIRLARLLKSPKDIPILAPIFIKEILYRVLIGQHGGVLQQIAIEGSSTNRISDVVEQIRNNFDKTLRIEKLAEIANMSISSLHRHFKAVTAMSPIQFQKHLRLQAARLLLLSESTDAAEIAFRVGYESPSQFSREYARMFGFPPKEDIKRLSVN